MADPIIATPGQIVAPPDWEALYQQHGGIKSSVMIPITDPQVQQMIAANPDLASTLQQHPIYRYYMNDGSYVSAFGQENGQDVQVVDYKPSAKFTQQHPANAAQTGVTGSNPRVPAGSVPRIEGTPIPGQPGQFDNSQPIRAWHDPNTGAVVAYEPLTPTEIQAWRGDQQQGQTGEVRKPVEGRPGWSSVTRTTVQGGNKTEATVYVGPDGKEVPSLPAETGTAESPVSGRPGWTQITTKTGNNTTITFRGPDGKVVETLPKEPKPGEIIRGGGQNGEDVQAVTGPDGTLTYQPITGAQTPHKPGQVVTFGGESYWAIPNADPSQPPTLTRIDPSHPPADDGPSFAPGMSPSEYLTQRRAWLMQQRRAGVSQQEVNALWDRDVQLATSRQNEASLAATQQNQRLSASTTGFQNALSTVTDLNRYLPVGSDLGGKGLEALLTLQRGNAQRMGGYGQMPGQLVVPPQPATPDSTSQVAAIPAPPTGSPVGAVANGVTGANVEAANQAVQAGTNAAIAPLLAQPPAVGAPRPEPVFRPQPPVDLPSPVSAIPESPYEFAARVATSAPWQMTEDDYRKAQALGLGQQFWATPGRSAA